ncbi:endonuclease/exonuclease/phosphatase family protein [Tunicatimonas pelagia]|uniref:endonuclease/exonuclease/phosphatase family protein n=1 Tax=Tunicatimonas pelagia TaxID=931531 RepID=UPI0026671C08|nr:endonuclease/exonuclease/phosphatase family protein [Tunicatimonas pelagia]WKN43368.1 endonuclease/exonuclease/phosphatase family protein [Tunicatimonas pelagia]
MFSKIILLLFLLLTMSFVEPSSTLKVITFNIRYDNPQDGEHRWDNRKERVVNLLKFYQADIFGLQEALHHQVTYLEENFSDFSRVGVGRDDGKEAGEYSPIFYNNTIFESTGEGTFWLSTTPNMPTKDWDAALPRIATWVMLRNRSTSDTILVCNTHFDHRGDTARQESAKLLASKLPELASNIPIILMGDFNSNPQSAPYRIIDESEALQDAWKKSELPPVGPEKSFSGFTVTPDLPGDRIDHIFVSASLKVSRMAIISEERGGTYPSDHFPVFVEIISPDS